MKKYIKPEIDILEIEVSPLLAGSDPIVDQTENNEPGTDRAKGYSFAGFDIWGMSEED